MVRVRVECNYSNRGVHRVRVLGLGLGLGLVLGLRFMVRVNGSR